MILITFSHFSSSLRSTRMEGRGGREKENFKRKNSVIINCCFQYYNLFGFKYHNCRSTILKTYWDTKVV